MAGWLAGLAGGLAGLSVRFKVLFLLFCFSPCCSVSRAVRLCFVFTFFFDCGARFLLPIAWTCLVCFVKHGSVEEESEREKRDRTGPQARRQVACVQLDSWNSRGMDPMGRRGRARCHVLPSNTSTRKVLQVAGTWARSWAWASASVSGRC